MNSKIKLLYLCSTILLMALVACNPDEPDPDTGDIRDKLVNTWKCTENSATYGTQNYYVEITKDNQSGIIVIDNFFNLGLGKSIKASVNGQTITINNQMVSGHLFNGTGTIASNFNSISWNYTFDEGNGPENVTATYTKM
ncbi:MAG: hypothetical protein N2449_09630 [Bacteroidales bacterium]|nr:hypothetical protein [Bacteroidales bacterium]